MMRLPQTMICGSSHPTTVMIVRCAVLCFRKRRQVDARALDWPQAHWTPQARGDGIIPASTQSNASSSFLITPSTVFNRNLNLNLNLPLDHSRCLSMPRGSLSLPPNHAPLCLLLGPLSDTRRY